MKQQQKFLAVALIGLLVSAIGGYLLYQELQPGPSVRAPQSGANPSAIIANKTYDATNGAEQVIVIGRGVTTPQSNNLSQSQIDNYTYDATNGARQVIVSSNSSDIPFINSTSLTDGDLLYYDTTGSEWLNAEGQLIYDDSTGILHVDGGVVFGNYTADPCGSLQEGALWYNDTANVMCFCDGTNDLKVHDNSACF
jgi:hypothetical protein